MKKITSTLIRIIFTWLIFMAVSIFIYFIINATLIISEFDLILGIIQGKESFANSVFVAFKIIFCVFILPVAYLALGYRHGFFTSLNYIINKIH